MSEITVNEAVYRFQQLIKVKTVSSKDGNFDKEEFAKFLPLLKELYPDAFAVIEAELVNEFGIKQAPTLVVVRDDGSFQTVANVSNIRKFIEESVNA